MNKNAPGLQTNQKVSINKPLAVSIGIIAGSSAVASGLIGIAALTGQIGDISNAVAIASGLGILAFGSMICAAVGVGYIVFSLWYYSQLRSDTIDMAKVIMAGPIVAAILIFADVMAGSYVTGLIEKVHPLPEEISALMPAPLDQYSAWWLAIAAGIALSVLYCLAVFQRHSAPPSLPAVPPTEE